MRPLMLLCIASGAWCGSVRHEQLTIRIFDYAPVPPETLGKALLESQEMFRKAGIEMKWLTCRPFIDERERCAPPLQSTDVLLKIVSESANKQMQSSGAFGCALRNKEVGLLT
jgi:hypothetical protein